jgi:PKD repeat protein
MNRKWIGLAGSIVWIVILAAAANAFEADFDPSIYNPDVSEVVNFEVCEPCLSGDGFRYSWDFDADGIPEMETDDTLVTYAFSSAGYYEAVLTVADSGGRTSTRRKGILVGRLPAFAVRELLAQSDGTILVLVTIIVTSDCSAIGFQEAMPQGWQVEVVDAGGAFAYPNLLTKTLEVVWGSQFVAADTVTFSYRLYPAYTSTLQGLSGEISGYTAEGRFTGRIAGELGMPQ